MYIHADSMEFESKKRTPVAEEIPESAHKGRMEEVLVIFITVEKEDEGRIVQIATEASADILDAMKQVGAERIMLYPYAHLSNSLGKPKASISILELIQQMITAKGAEVMRAPFGWYKSFDIKCKGHPLSELSRDFKGKEIAEKPKGEDKYFVLEENGKEISIEDFRNGSECMMQMIAKEALGKEAEAVGEPEYLRLCKKFGMQWEIGRAHV